VQSNLGSTEFASLSWAFTPCKALYVSFEADRLPCELGDRPMTRLRALSWQAALLLCLFSVLPTAAEGGVIRFWDRDLFAAALGGTPVKDDFESYDVEAIADGTSRGDFVYTFDPTLVEPWVAYGAYTERALGGPPDLPNFDPGVFLGGNEVTLTFGSQTLRAFGADFYFGPSGPPVPQDTYRLRINDGSDDGEFVGNLTLDGSSDVFFLGLIVTPGSEFSSVSLLSVQDDPGFLVPAYQVDNLEYATVSTVPEPSSLLALLAGGGVLAACRARLARSRNGAARR
jgi:hypothetical protein